MQNSLNFFQCRLLLTLVNSVEPTVISEEIIVTDDIIVGLPPLQNELPDFLKTNFASLADTPPLKKLIDESGKATSEVTTLRNINKQ